MLPLVTFGLGNAEKEALLWQASDVSEISKNNVAFPAKKRAFWGPGRDCLQTGEREMDVHQVLDVLLTAERDAEEGPDCAPGHHLG